MFDLLQENGLFGLWSGMQPRMVGELLFVAISGSVTFGVKNYVLDKKNPEQRAVLKYVENISSYVAQSLTYPFTVSTNIRFSLVVMHEIPL